MLETKEYLQKFNTMQTATVDVTRKVASLIEPGMSELYIAEIYERELAEVGLAEHWYPIIVYAGNWTGKPISRRYHLPSPDVIVKENDMIILDCTPLDKTVWSNWAETFMVGSDDFFSGIITDAKSIVEATHKYANTDAKTIGDIFDFCSAQIEKFDMQSLDPRNDVGHSIFQVPEGQTVDKTPLEDRLFISDEYRNSPITGIVSIEPQAGRIHPVTGETFGAKIQKVLII